MNGEKIVFKIVPGEKLSKETFSYVSWPDFDRSQSVKKVKLISLEKGDEVIELPVAFCSSLLSGDLIDCVREDKNIITNQITLSKYVDLKNRYAFVYYDDVLVKLSMDSSSIISERLGYNYLTLEESDTSDNKYYFSDDQGNIIDSPNNDSLQYLERDVKKEVIEITKDILPKISENVILSKAFVKIFVEKLTESQLKTFANSLSNEQQQVLAQNLTDGQLQKIIPELSSNQLQILAEHLTDGQFQALVDHLTNHQLQTLAKELNPEKLQIIVSLLDQDQFKALIKTLNDEQFTVLVKDLAEHHLTILSKELEGDQLKELVNSLREDQLKDLVNKLDNEKLQAIAQDLTDPNRVQMIIESLADNPEKLQAFADKMPNQQFTKLLNELNVEVIKDIIHNLPYEKVKAVIGDKEQSKSILDTFKANLEEQNEHNKKMIEMLKHIQDNTPELGQAPDFTIVDINNDSLLFV
ncbi:Putative MgtE intracellular N domain protein [Wolbachia endosymbiont of Drosophila simulans wNo]|uniref:magnesium transporter MgtE N-terminal domain-containing protein n=1 Tax=Wolbachia endosymbiont of Drosophila simulans TaxID=77038 RepID=UPI0002D250B7|nr:MgtE intracellular N domain protein [Wolbachia endosymbiont of Drosophila simulans]AGJ99104.1 Putative MgtE intracellular N domain protein [Wolbachia endosymbiont of Drosophila simulans wNo]